MSKKKETQEQEKAPKLLSEQMREEWAAAQLKLFELVAEEKRLKDEREAIKGGRLDNPLAATERLVAIEAKLQMLPGLIRKLRALADEKKSFMLKRQTYERSPSYRRLMGQEATGI